MVLTAVLFSSLVLSMAAAKKAENALEDVAGTQQNLSNLLFFRYLYNTQLMAMCIVN
jgi:NADH:ubiquinone oxidoreductase subunit 6 (subunit J)